MALQLRKFNMNMIQDDQIVVLIGKRNTGKSFLTKDLLYYHQDIPVGTVISPTENANKFYSDIVPPAFIHDEYDQRITNEFMKRQKQLKKRLVNGETNIDNRAFLIMDDCLYDKNWQKDKRIR
jgi:tRNA A37 threonylcarbamoyladenosine biosynthesis protein TsaE